VKFIDLFAGLGGFHSALQDLGHECTLASEIDHDLRKLYENNWGMVTHGDIRELKLEDVPDHEILCAGFPCQPFSKAGFQQGFGHATDGTLFSEILRILAVRKPEFLILENVPNFERHDHGNTWKVAAKSLEKLGYEVELRKYSPHDFGVPQIRNRAYIVGRLGSLDDFMWPDKSSDPTDIRSILDDNPLEALSIPENLSHAIDIWQLFLDRFPTDQELPSYPIWSMEFGATYPVQGINKSRLRLKDLHTARGAFGDSLANVTRWTQLDNLLPTYARYSAFPLWKQKFIQQNRELYAQNHKWMDDWLPLIRTLPASFQKLEWNCRGEIRQLRQHVLQTRPSGIRVKRKSAAPALVALTTSQVPIITWEDRYMTQKECLRLQSLQGLTCLPESRSKTFSALGNAVNAEVVKQIAHALIGSADPNPIEKRNLVTGNPS
jgi:DNA (cytosine-5)-methyltransferase 1